jgi:hypothetical protein
MVSRGDIEFSERKPPAENPSAFVRLCDLLMFFGDALLFQVWHRF